MKMSNLNIAFKVFGVRFLRNMVGVAIAVALSLANDTVGLIPVPEIYKPIIPLVLGPALNAAAKFGRTLLDDGVVKSLSKFV